MAQLLRSEVAVYRNGYTQFVDRWKLEGSNPEKISIPVLREDLLGRSHLKHIFKSFQVFGAVTHDPLQNIQPRALPMAQGQASMRDLFTFVATEFAGAKVALHVQSGRKLKKIGGTLAWMTDRIHWTSKHRTAEPAFVLATGSGLRPVPFSRVCRVSFDEPEEQEAFQGLIDQVKRRRAADFTEVFTMVQAASGAGGTEFTVTFGLPGLPPVFSYRYLRAEADQPAILVAQARIENCFARPWKNVRVRIPTVLPQMVVEKSERTERVAHRQRERFDEDLAGHGGEDDAMTRMFEPSDRARALGRQPQPAAGASREVTIEALGDGHVFDVEGEITLLPGASAMAQLFRSPVSEPEEIMYLRKKEGVKKVVRAQRFIYEHGCIVPTGNCVVYSGTMTDGEGTLKRSRPGQRRIVDHADTQDLSLTSEKSDSYTTTIGCLASNDEIVAKVRSRRRVQYRIENRTREDKLLVIDVERTLEDSKIEVRGSKKKPVSRSNGWRIEVIVPPTPEEDFLVEVNEVAVVERPLRLAEAGMNLADWVQRYLFQSNEPKIFELPGLRELHEVFTTVRKKRYDISKRDQEVGALEARADKIRRDLQVVGDASFGEASNLKQMLLAIREEAEKWLGDERQQKVRDAELDEGRLAELLRKLDVKTMPEEEVTEA